ncbi:myelin protein zero-like protein 1 [Hyperolius riggenbachi]|uniref:myelin protein zero-like protein 1 n=1 Tax=Hyperolius riggenbachi TaxID=752182 RepID=UPI0035A2864E
MRLGTVVSAAFLFLLITNVHGSFALEVYAPEEITVENGTQALLPCTFKSSEVTRKETSVIWRYIEDGGSSKGSTTVLMFTGGIPYPGEGRFKERVTWAGDLNKKDVSIKIDKINFKDNGTYTCDVLNPPDVNDLPKEIKLRVVEKGLDNPVQDGEYVTIDKQQARGLLNDIENMYEKVEGFKNNMWASISQYQEELKQLKAKVSKVLQM